MAVRHGYGKIVTDGLVLALDAADSNSITSGSTKWTDVSGNGHHATLENGPVYSSDYKGGVSFDATNDQAPITTDLSSLQSWNAHWENSDEMTIVAFGIFDFSGLSSYRDGIIGQRYYYDLGFSFHLHANSNTINKRLAFNIGANANFRNTGHSYSDHDILTGVPCMVSVRHKGTTREVKFGLNTDYNVQYLPTAISASQYMTDETNHVELVRYNSAGSFDEKTLYSIQVYNRFLTDAEMLQNFNHYKSRFNI